MGEHDSALYLEAIIESIQHIEQYVGDKSSNDLEDDDQLMDSVCMRLQLIGEMANKISDTLKTKEP